MCGLNKETPWKLVHVSHTKKQHFRVNAKPKPTDTSRMPHTHTHTNLIRLGRVADTRGVVIVAKYLAYSQTFSAVRSKCGQIETYKTSNWTNWRRIGVFAPAVQMFGLTTSGPTTDFGELSIHVSNCGDSNRAEGRHIRQNRINYYYIFRNCFGVWSLVSVEISREFLFSFLSLFCIVCG